MILHNYEFSNYSEKVRLLLSYKDVSWKSVNIPSYGVKPDYTRLTGGYRRAPALQIGADVYCDTRLIAAVLEDLFPSPTIYPGESMEQVKAQCEAIIYWAENSLMRPLALYVTGLHAEEFPMAFHIDRAKLHGKPPPSLNKVRESARTYFPQMKAQLQWIEGLLSGGQKFILSDALSLADLAVYQCPWFLEKITGSLSLLDGFPKVLQWIDRVRAVGQGERSSISAKVALGLASDSFPKDLIHDTTYQISEKIELGSMVEVCPFNEYSSSYGKLVHVDETRIVICNTSVDLGDIFVHFPRLGYRLWEKCVENA